MIDKIYPPKKNVGDENSCSICCGGCSSAFLKNAPAPPVPFELQQLKIPVFELSEHGGCCDMDDTEILPTGCSPFESKESSELSLPELDAHFFENTKFILKHTNSGTVMLWASVLALQYILLSRLAHLFGGQLSSDSKTMQKIEGKYKEISNPNSTIRRHSHGLQRAVFSPPIPEGHYRMMCPGGGHEIVKEPENVKIERSVFFPKEHYERREMGMFSWLLGITAIAGASWWFLPEEMKNTITEDLSSTAHKYVLDYFSEPEDQNTLGAGGGNAPTFTGTGIETSSGQVATQYFGDNKTQTHILEGFRFASGQSSIDSPPMETVDILDMLYNSGECFGYQLHGYTDSIGSEESNGALSIARASFIQSVLVENSDMSLGSVEVFGHGEKNPLWSNDTVEGRAQNRRVEIICNPL